MVVFWQKWLYSGKVVVVGQIGCIREKVVVFGQKCLNSCKIVLFGQSGCIRAKVVLIGQCRCIQEKWLYSGKTG